MAPVSVNTLKNHDVSKMEMEPDQGPEGTKVRKLYEPCTYYPVFWDFSESPKMLECIESLIGPDIMCHYSKLNMKPPKIGAILEWHQDLSYYPFDQSRFTCSFTVSWWCIQWKWMSEDPS